jgi:hypothetical protein
MTAPLDPPTIPDDVMKAATAVEDEILAADLHDLDTQIIIARAILAEREREQWQAIETYPQDGSDVLVCVTYSLSQDEWETVQWVDSRRADTPWFIYPGRVDIPFPPTHWMPLPPAPKGGA